MSCFRVATRSEFLPKEALMAICKHDIRETRRGAGPCRIEAEVKLRNGKPNWWCRTHGMAAGAPDGNPLETCPGAWLDPVPEDECIELDVADGETAIWGAIPAAVEIGDVEREPGKVHVHRRRAAGAPKDIDSSFAIVTVHSGQESIVIEGTAAVAYSISELSGRVVVPLTCPHCREVHIDELKFATFPHLKHLCNSCGRNFRDRNPSISNPLADAYKQLGLGPRPEPVRPDRPLNISSCDYRGVALYPSNSAIVSTMSRPEEEGIHVHAWAHDGTMAIDETFSSVVLDGEAVDEILLRILAVQRALAHGTPIIALACAGCGTSICDSAESFMEPSTEHACQECGHTTRTQRRIFVNPLLNRFAHQQ